MRVGGLGGDVGTDVPLRRSSGDDRTVGEGPYEEPEKRERRRRETEGPPLPDPDPVETPGRNRPLIRGPPCGGPD